MQVLKGWSFSVETYVVTIVIHHIIHYPFVGLITFRGQHLIATSSRYKFLNCSSKS